MTCSVCNHEKRAEIEQALLCRSMGDLSVTIESIAKKYDLKPIDVQIHALMHATISEPNGVDDKPVTLVESVRFKEAESLRQSTFEYQNTLTLLGAKLREEISAHTDKNPTLQKLSRATVDLYLGLGGEIRSAVDSLVRMNNMINGEDNGGLKGLADLVTAIRSSGKPSE